MKENDLNGYAKQTDLNNYVSTSALTNKLKDYIKKGNIYEKSDIDNLFLTKEDALNIYPTKAEVDNDYLSKLDASRKYLKIEDYRGLKDATVISKEFEDNTMDEFNNILETSYLRNGFYIVHKNNVVIVKDNVPINIIEDGVQRPILEWKWEN